MKTDAQRSEKYVAKTAATTVSLKFASQLAQMKASFAAMTNALVAIQLQVAALLDTAGVVGPTRGRYHAYANRLFKITNEFAGATATAMAQAEHDKWATVCTPAILVDIALDVFNLVVV